MRKSVLLVSILFIIQLLTAQNAPIGQWKDYLSYKNGVSVAEGGGKVYCATKSGVFIFNKNDNSMVRLSKVNGLADVEPNVLNYNKFNNKVLIAYKNSNIDIIDNNTIINLADIKRKAIIGNKAINNITFINQFAYLSCGFGIVVIDMNKSEVSDTYYIGATGASINVRDITTDGTFIYAAADGGVYRASLSNSNLASFTAWTRMAGLPTQILNVTCIYNTITAFKGKIFANSSKLLSNGLYNKDTTFVYDGTSWSPLPASFGGTIKTLKNCPPFLVMTQSGVVSLIDTTLTVQFYFAGYFSDLTRAEQAVMDDSYKVWIADDKFGLVECTPGQSSKYFYPKGPSSSYVAAMSSMGNDLAVAPGGGADGYLVDGLYLYNGSDWTNVKGNFPTIVNLDTIFSIQNVLIDSNNSKHVYASTGFAGVLEFTDGVPVKLYNSSNSSLQRINFSPGYTPIWTTGLAMSLDNTLWVANSGVPSSLSMKKYDGTWQALNFSPIIGNAPNITQILVDKNDQKWFILDQGGGIVVYNGTTDPPSTSNTKKMSTAIGSGALPSTNVFCMAQDQNGEIWVGTDKGIAVFYSPESVFSGQNYDAQQILLTQDGLVQILLLTEQVQAIAVDDANQKWISTASSGVFLMSADGTKQIYHFDASNSPLFSNNVKSIAINHKSGEVFFGTDKGLISFRGKATEGLSYFTDVYTFPNPVKHDYQGPIAIKGLIASSTVKITDISGTLVYETVSLGGQAIWDGKNFNGSRVSTGVYMVFCTSPDGSQKTTTKILFIN